MKRSAPLKSNGFKRADRIEAREVSKVLRKAPSTEPKPPRGPKMRKCSVKTCRQPFASPKSFVSWCSPECGTVVAVDRLAKQKAKEQRADRAETKKKLDAYKTIPELKAELQVIFNTFIRLRDEKYSCICCGKWPKTDGALRGGSWDAAHWRSRGSSDHLRYNEDNVHKALKDCNEYGHYDYRGGLVKKIGITRVEALESDHAIFKWTREWLESKKIEYREKIKELKNNGTN